MVPQSGLSATDNVDSRLEERQADAPHGLFVVLSIQRWNQYVGHQIVLKSGADVAPLILSSKFVDVQRHQVGALFE